MNNSRIKFVNNVPHLNEFPPRNMKPENKRIFISDLPETYTKEELENSFSKYGRVSSVEIKERKELTPKNSSLFFAYVNLVADDASLNQCFKDLSNKKWSGQYVQLQLARESFLDRLKREREEANQAPSISTPAPIIIPEPPPKKLAPTHTASSSSSSSSSSSDSEPEAKPPKKLAPEPDRSDLIIKSNKSAKLAPGGLKIPSFGKAPIAEIPAKKPTPKNDSEANKKRLQHLKEMRQSYESQKSLVQKALAYGAGQANNNKKIVFNEVKAKDDSLFDGDDSDFEANFEVKEQFQGKKGQQLLELQSKFKNDKRFALDERFMEAEEEEAPKDDLEAEKEAQLKILGEVLGRQAGPSRREPAPKRAMLKFDPCAPEHNDLELKVAPPEKKKKRDKGQQQQQEEKPGPEVSKEVFYKVTERLKETLEEKQGFSLLSMFGKVEEREEEEVESERKLSKKPLNGQNPFKYDSSEEEEEDDIPHASSGRVVEAAPVKTPVSQSVFWTEPFFFKNDDFRLQEGLDFIEKIKSEDKEFGKLRRDLKGIVKAKVRNNERKNKMFKRKLGGGNKRRHVRMKKAFKR